MFARLRRHWLWGAGLLLAIAGCQSARPAKQARARTVYPSADIPLDVRHTPTALARTDETPHPSTPVEELPREEIRLASSQEKPPEKPRPPLGERLQLPADMPGGDADVIVLPTKDPDRKLAIERQFPTLPPLAELPQPASGPEGKALRLADLQRLGQAHSPITRQAAAAIEAARGVAVQVGLCPNPRIGYEGDTMAQANSAGLQGGFIEQTIKTGHKLELARAAAQIDVDNAELALRRAGIDLATSIRRTYLDVLKVQRTLTVARAFAVLTAEVYSIQVTRLRLGQAAVYEPLQARVLAVQARAAFLQAQNRYQASWRQLATALGLPEMPPTQLAGSLDQPVPRFQQAPALARILEQHTDILTAGNAVNRARLALRLAEALPIPDLDVRYMAQRDNTTPPFGVVHTVVLGLQIPVWNRNQGGIREAHGNLSRASEEPARVKNELTAQVAAAFQRYDTNRSLVLLYRDQLVPDQVRAYRGVYRRYDTEPEALNFNDVITAQQTLAETMRNYVEAIGNLWDSVVDVASLLQLDDLDGDGAGQPGQHDVCPLPPLERLPAPQTTPPAKPMPKANLKPVLQRVSYEIPYEMPDQKPCRASASRFAMPTETLRFRSRCGRSGNSSTLASRCVLNESLPLSSPSAMIAT